MVCFLGGDNPANPEATVRQVAMAKSTVQVTLDEVEGMVEKIIERRGKEYCLLGKKAERSWAAMILEKEL